VITPAADQLTDVIIATRPAGAGTKPNE
jgi:hypothetical protein